VKYFTGIVEKTSFYVKGIDKPPRTMIKFLAGGGKTKGRFYRRYRVIC
jgi:hypothetical protein